MRIRRPHSALCRPLLWAAGAPLPHRIAANPPVAKVFSPVQKARLAAVSCPHFPDIVQIARLLAEEGEA